MWGCLGAPFAEKIGRILERRRSLVAIWGVEGTSVMDGRMGGGDAPPPRARWNGSRGKGGPGEGAKKIEK